MINPEINLWKVTVGSVFFLIVIIVGIKFGINGIEFFGNSLAITLIIALWREFRDAAHNLKGID